jgi:selenocysteine lyase/cysteine desulfurase
MTETPLEFDQVNTEGICYLNHAKEATLSPAARLAGWKALQTPAWEAADPLVLKSDIRKLFASLIGAAPEDIAIVASTAFAMTLAANNIARTHAKGKIVVVQDQMCSQVYPWQKIVKDQPNKFELVVVEPSSENNDDDFTKDILDCLDETVIVVAVSPLHWSHGALVDLDAISRKCQAETIHLIVDGTQSIGILPMDVTRLQPTLVACSIQKWLRAPPGLSLVYMNNKNVHDLWQPLDQHGRSRTGMLPNWNARAGTMTPDGYPDEFLEDARKFDSGGHTTTILLSMLRTSLTEVVASDLESCQLQLKELMKPLLDWAVERDLWMPTHHAYHLVGLRPKNLSVDEMLHICNQLEADGIFVSVRNSVFRISPYITNTPQDIQRLIDGFDKYIFGE